MAGGRDDRSSSASTRDALALLRLPPPLAVGLILVGCCPGGTVSNVVTLIARADVALSVMMATLSTLAAVLLIPPLTGLLAGRYVPVDGWKLLLDVLLAALLLHGGGFFLGWLIPALLGQPSR